VTSCSFGDIGTSSCFEGVPDSHIMLTYQSYAFRSTEKVALQEIGPRFTLKLRSLRKGIPAVRSVCEGSKPLSLAMQPDLEGNGPSEDSQDQSAEVMSSHEKISAPKEDEFMWKWKVCSPLVA
jgi:ribosome production factor 1